MITKRKFSLPDDNSFIFGPRGTGKSTWLRNNLPDAKVVNLLDDMQFAEYLANPGRLKELVLGNLDTYETFVIDEIQKVPRLLDVVHDLIESHKDLKFILTGSSARKLKRSGVNLLAGRALKKNMFPFIASELQDSFSIDHALKYGLVPLVFDSNDPAAKLASYVALYLKEEVQEEGLVRNIGDFARFLQVMSFSHGSILNVSNIARETGVTRKIVDNYISILDDLLLCYLLPVFNKRAKRAVVSHNKFYYFDSGVFFHLRPKGPLDNAGEMSGISLEGLVLHHIKAFISYSGLDLEVFYWRTKTGVEVDFIIYGENVFQAIEVKNAKKVFSQDLKGLKSFVGDYPIAEPVMLYRGTDKLNIEGITCWPVEEFLMTKLCPAEL